MSIVSVNIYGKYVSVQTCASHVLTCTVRLDGKPCVNMYCSHLYVSHVLTCTVRLDGKPCVDMYMSTYMPT